MWGAVFNGKPAIMFDILDLISKNLIKLRLFNSYLVEMPSSLGNSIRWIFLCPRSSIRYDKDVDFLIPRFVQYFA